MPHERNLHHELPDGVLVLGNGRKDPHAQHAIIAEDFPDTPCRRNQWIVCASRLYVLGDPYGAAVPFDGKVAGRHAEFVLEVRDAVGGLEQAVDYAVPTDCGAVGWDRLPFWNLLGRLGGLAVGLAGLPVEFHAFGALFPFGWDASRWRRLIAFDPLETEKSQNRLSKGDVGDLSEFALP